jgi:glutamate racemase
LIDNFASDCVITRVAADALVVEAEAYLSGVTPNTEHMQAALAPLWQAITPSSSAHPALDTVVLGCTHFPLLKPWLTQLAPAPLHWVDSGDAIARRVTQVVDELNSDQHDGRCFTTAPAANLTAGLARYGFKAPQLLKT